MSEKQIVWLLISDFLVTQGLYVATDVKNAFPNNVPITEESEFVVITRLMPVQKALPQQDFDVQDQTITYSNQIDVDYQLDFYGVNAADAAGRMMTYLNSSNASNWLTQYNCGIGAVYMGQNLTADLDRGNYVTRYALKFVLLAGQSVTIDQDGINRSDIPISIIQVTNKEITQ